MEVDHYTWNSIFKIHRCFVAGFYSDFLTIILVTLLEATELRSTVASHNTDSPLETFFSGRKNWILKIITVFLHTNHYCNFSCVSSQWELWIITAVISFIGCFYWLFFVLYCVKIELSKKKVSYYVLLSYCYIVQSEKKKSKI